MAITSTTATVASTTSVHMSPTSTASSSFTMTPTATATAIATTSLAPATAPVTAHRISPTSYLSKVFSLVDHPASGLRFLILDCPSDSTLPSVLKVFASHNVTDVVRVCEPTYATASLAAAGIQVHDLPFQDGGVPSAPLVHKFMAVVNAALAKGDEATVAVHCIAGLGRAPLMVALALIEFGMPPLDAITYIRARRRGAFNTAQVKWIDAYKPQGLAGGVGAGGKRGGAGEGRVGGILSRSRSVESGASASGRGGIMGSMWRKMMSSLSMGGGRRKSHPGVTPPGSAVLPANA